MSRLEDIFERCRAEGRGAFSAYIAGGHPSIAESEAMLRAIIDAGADFVEVGIPFSDPAADGPIIQAATAQVIANGTSVADILVMVQRVRADHPDVGLVCMTYANIAFQMGWQGFANHLARNGFDGAIVPDAPPEESGPLRTALAAAGIEWIPLVAPTTPLERMKSVAATATGFLYVVGNVGTTGQQDAGGHIESVVARARSAAGATPLVVGFGLRTPGDVQRAIRAGADGAIVGSAIVEQISNGAAPAVVAEAVRSLMRGTKA